MSFNVRLTDDAVRDLVEICDYLDQRESPERADYVFTRIERALNSLSEHPQRGSYPKELLDLGIREYREIFFTPFRMIYRVTQGNGYLLLIADGRQDMKTLLEHRLLRS